MRVLALVAGLALRLWFLCHPMPFDDDTDVYAELARNLFHHGVYGFTEGARIAPTLIRLPGYPVFLGLASLVFGRDSLAGSASFTAVFVIQIALDLFACWLIGDFVREQAGERAGLAALWLAALCPFTAGYSAIALTESLSVFAVALGLWSFGRMLDDMRGDERMGRGHILWAGVSMSLAVLLRPDGVLLGVAMVVSLAWCGWRQGKTAAGLRMALVCGLLAAIPLVPWTARNWRTFHVVQPLAPRRVNNPGEYVTYGFYRWMNTWSVDIVSTGDVFWRLGSGRIDIGDLPSRAFDSPAQHDRTAALLAEYNAGFQVPVSLDARFAALAEERRRDHPWLCRVEVPVLRVVDMALRPRTETLSLSADWWNFDAHRRESIEAATLGLLNLFYFVAAMVGLVREGRCRARWLVLPVVYIGLRCLLLSTMENSEPRYTLEAFPLILALGGCAFARADRSSPTNG